MKKIYQFVCLSLFLALVSCANNESNNDTDAKTNKLQVSVQIAQMEEIDIRQTYPSVLEANAINNLVPLVGERIDKINVNISDFVKKGQVLVEMNTLKYEQARLKNLQEKKSYERLMALEKEGAVTTQDMENAALAYEVDEKVLQELKKNTFLYAPMDGVISAKNFDEGDVFSGSMPLIRIEQINPLKLHINVSEAYYSLLSKKNNVSISLDAYAGRKFDAEISRIYPVVDASSHTVTVELKVPNKDYLIRPGMYAKVDVLFAKKKSLVVPDIAILKQQGSGRSYVYVLDANYRAMMRFVDLGGHQGDKIEILSGLKEGEKIVVEGQHSLKEGEEVELINKN